MVSPRHALPNASRAARILLAAGVSWMALALVVPQPAAADIYTYTDDNGVMHFSNERKPGSKLYAKTKPRKKKGRRAGVTPVSYTHLTLPTKRIV